MNNRIVVACGLMNHSIYAQTVHNNVVDNSSTCDVTDMAIKAVRDYMVDSMLNKSYAKANTFGYQWNRSDGKVVKLICSIEDK